MRLINTKTLKIEHFSGSVIEPYVILSHTWEDEEVTYQDMNHRRRASQKKGFAKIKKTCLIAQEDGFKYAWIDTCCIDKTSSAELSESINSMFNWYKRAVICYAFLSDLPGSRHGTDELTHQDLVGCRWFRRGWTLQELLAPTDVVFFDKTWKQRGVRSGLKQAIRVTTDISEDVLTDPSKLSLVPLARRMSWASGRSTTCVEDMAYCLLGIFDVNMPMIYGEGPRAFIRLQEEILRKTTDLSIFAWQTVDPSYGYRGLLARSPSEFRQCFDIIPNTDQFQFRDEISITNKGIRINATLHHSKTWNGLFMMDLDCYHGERKSDSRISILLCRKLDGYVRRFPQQTTASTYYSQPRTIYVRSDVDSKAETMIDDNNYGIHINFFGQKQKHTVYGLKAVPRAYWDVNERFFFTQGLTVFTGFLRFNVSPSLPNDHAYTPEQISMRDGLQMLLVCDIEEEKGIEVSVFREQDLRHDDMAAGFISPFEDFDRYSPQGDRESLAFLSSRVRGKPQMQVTAVHPNYDRSYEISVQSEQLNTNKFEISIFIGSSTAHTVRLDPDGINSQRPITPPELTMSIGQEF